MENRERRYALWKQEFAEYSARDTQLIEAVERYLKIKEKRRSVDVPNGWNAVGVARQFTKASYIALVAATVWSLLVPNSKSFQNEAITNLQTRQARTISFLAPGDTFGINKIYLGYRQLK